MKKKIAILASGGGSNAQRIVEHFENHHDADVVLIASNNPNSGALEMAQTNRIETAIITRENFKEGDAFIKLLQSKGVDWVILAGFLWMIPVKMVHAFEGKMVNIHPSLLPKYGGKGMYGTHVHQAVKASGDTESGMTIHWVNEQYDDGAIIFQAKTKLEDSDSAQNIASKVLELEHKHYTTVIEGLLREYS